jgi:hypothetical protein
MMGAREYQVPFRDRFEAVSQRILAAPDLTAAVREMLKDIPGTGPKD